MAEKKRRARGAQAETTRSRGAAVEGEEASRPFEEELAVLEKAVDDLERGELTLEEAISSYEGGFRSLRRCYELLEGARRRVESLAPSEDDGSEGRSSGAVWAPLRLSGFDEETEDGEEEAGGDGSGG